MDVANQYIKNCILLRISTPKATEVLILNEDITEVCILNKVNWMYDRILVNKLGLFKEGRYFEMKVMKIIYKLDLMVQNKVLNENIERKSMVTMHILKLFELFEISQISKIMAYT